MIIVPVTQFTTPLPVKALAQIPNSTHVVVAGGSGQSPAMLQVRNFITGETVCKKFAHSSTVIPAVLASACDVPRFFSDGEQQFILSCSNGDNSIIVADPSSQMEVRRHTIMNIPNIGGWSRSSTIHKIVISPSGEFAVVSVLGLELRLMSISKLGNMMIHDPEHDDAELACITVTEEGHQFRDFAFDPSGSLLAVVSTDGKLRLLDAMTLEKRYRSIDCKTDFFAVTFSLDSRYVAAGGGNRRYPPHIRNSSYRNNDIIVYDLFLAEKAGGGKKKSSHREKQQPPVVAKLVGHERPIRSLSFISSAMILTCGDDATLRVWSLPLQREMRCYHVPQTRENRIAHTPGSEFVFVFDAVIDTNAAPVQVYKLIM